MKSTGAGWLRLAGAFGLYLLIGILAIPTLPAYWLSGAGLWLIEGLASKANELRTGRGQ